jgi:uroporphyrinogen-III synthase
MAIKNPVDLQGMRVLLTRPAGRAVALQRALTEVGVEVLHVPLMEISPLAAAEHEAVIGRCRSHIMNLDLYQRIIFISVNAVEFGMQLIDECWPQWPQGVTSYAIGEATAQALAKWDVAALSGGPSMDSEGLLARPELQVLEHEKVLIVRGLGGRETLADGLRQRGAKVDYAECYQRQASLLAKGELTALLDRQQVDVVCLNSGETLTYFHGHCPPEQCRAALLLPSQRVAEQAEGLGYTQVFRAENAGTAATIAALIQMREDDERR